MSQYRKNPPLRRARATYKARPHRDEPGTLLQQFAAVAFWLDGDDDERERDPEETWQAARRLAIPHASGDTQR